MSEASINALVERIGQLEDELSQANEAHALTTQRLGEANQKLNKANERVGIQKIALSKFSEALKAREKKLDKVNENNAGLSEIIKEMRAQLDTANKRIEEYWAFILWLAREVEDRADRDILIESIQDEVEERIAALRALEVTDG